MNDAEENSVETFSETIDHQVLHDIADLCIKYSELESELEDKVLNKLISYNVSNFEVNILDFIGELESTIINEINLTSSKGPKSLLPKVFFSNTIEEDTDKDLTLIQETEDANWNSILAEFNNLVNNKKDKDKLICAKNDKKYISKKDVFQYVENMKQYNAIIKRKKDSNFYSLKKKSIKKLKDLILKYIDLIIDIFVEVFYLYQDDRTEFFYQLDNIINSKSKIFAIKELIIIQFNVFFINQVNKELKSIHDIDVLDNRFIYFKLFSINVLRKDNPFSSYKELREILDQNKLSYTINGTFMVKNHIPMLHNVVIADTNERKRGKENLDNKNNKLLNSLFSKDIFNCCFLSKHFDKTNQVRIWNNEKYYLYHKIVELLNNWNCSTTVKTYINKQRKNITSVTDCAYCITGLSIRAICEDDIIEFYSIQNYKSIDMFTIFNDIQNSLNVSKVNSNVPINIKEIFDFVNKQKYHHQNIPQGIATQLFQSGEGKKPLLKTKLKMSYENDFLNHDHWLFEILLLSLLNNAFPEKCINSNWNFVDKVFSFIVLHHMFYLNKLDGGLYLAFNDNHLKYDNMSYDIEQKPTILDYRGYLFPNNELVGNDSLTDEEEEDFVISRFEFLIKYVDYDEREWLSFNNVSLDIVLDFIKDCTKHLSSSKQNHFTHILLEQYNKQKDIQNDENRKNILNSAIGLSFYNLLQRPKIFLINCLAKSILNKIENSNDCKQTLTTVASMINKFYGLPIELCYTNYKTQFLENIESDEIKKQHIILFLFLFATFFDIIIVLITDNDSFRVVYPLFPISKMLFHTEFDNMEVNQILPFQMDLSTGKLTYCTYRLDNLNFKDNDDMGSIDIVDFISNETFNFLEFSKLRYVYKEEENVCKKVYYNIDNEETKKEKKQKTNPKVDQEDFIEETIIITNEEMKKKKKKKDDNESIKQGKNINNILKNNRQNDVSDTAITTIKDVSAMASSQRSAQLKIIQSHIDLSLETNINNLNNNTPFIHGDINNFVSAKTTKENMTLSSKIHEEKSKISIEKSIQIITRPYLINEVTSTVVSNSSEVTNVETFDVNNESFENQTRETNEGSRMFGEIITKTVMNESFKTVTTIPSHDEGIKLIELLFVISRTINDSGESIVYKTIRERENYLNKINGVIYEQLRQLICGIIGMEILNGAKCHDENNLEFNFWLNAINRYREFYTKMKITASSTYFDSIAFFHYVPECIIDALEKWDKSYCCIPTTFINLVDRHYKQLSNNNNYKPDYKSLYKGKILLDDIFSNCVVDGIIQFKEHSDTTLDLFELRKQVYQQQNKDSSFNLMDYPNGFLVFSYFNSKNKDQTEDLKLITEMFEYIYQNKNSFRFSPVRKFLDFYDLLIIKRKKKRPKLDQLTYLKNNISIESNVEKQIQSCSDDSHDKMFFEIYLDFQNKLSGIYSDDNPVWDTMITKTQSKFEEPAITLLPNKTLVFDPDWINNIFKIGFNEFSSCFIKLFEGLINQLNMGETHSFRKGFYVVPQDITEKYLIDVAIHHKTWSDDLEIFLMRLIMFQNIYIPFLTASSVIIVNINFKETTSAFITVCTINCSETSNDISNNDILDTYVNQIMINLERLMTQYFKKTRMSTNIMNCFDFTEPKKVFINKHATINSSLKLTNYWTIYKKSLLILVLMGILEIKSNNLIEKIICDILILTEYDGLVKQSKARNFDLELNSLIVKTVLILINYTVYKTQLPIHGNKTTYSMNESKKNNYKRINKNNYKYFAKSRNDYIKLTNDDISSCICKNSCNYDCYNRASKIECNDDICSIGPSCGNRLFKNNIYKKTEVFQEYKRGLGLKLIEDAKQGDLIIEYVGEVIDFEEVEKRLVSQRANRKDDNDFYIMYLESNTYIDAKMEGNDSRFINHSCKPNCKVERWIVLDKYVVGIFAITDIKSSTPLSYDYKFLTNEKNMFTCACQSNNCRKTITSSDTNIRYNSFNLNHDVLVEESNNNTEQVHLENNTIDSVIHPFLFKPPQINRNDFIRTEPYREKEKIRTNEPVPSLQLPKFKQIYSPTSARDIILNKEEIQKAKSSFSDRILMQSDIDNKQSSLASNIFCRANPPKPSEKPSEISKNDQFGSPFSESSFFVKNNIDNNTSFSIIFTKDSNCESVSSKDGVVDDIEEESNNNSLDQLNRYSVDHIVRYFSPSQC